MKRLAQAHLPAPPRALALAVAGLALALLAAGGCSSLGQKVTGKRPPFSEVQPAVAFEMLRDNPGLPVIDLRSRFEFTGPAGHIKGAQCLPLDDLGDHLDELSALQDRTFLIYCGHDSCGRKGLDLLKKAGFEEVVLMAGGIDGWIERGFGTVTGPPPPMRFKERSGKVKVD